VRALKVLVIVMGVVLVGGFVTLVMVIAGRVAERQAAAPAPSPASVPQPFAAAPLELPAGARIDSMAVGSDRLVLDVGLADGNREIVVIDLASGQRLGAIPLHTAPTAPAPTTPAAPEAPPAATPPAAAE
jgi:hypothetical protein